MNTVGGMFRAAALIGVAGLALAFAAGTRAQNQNSQNQNASNNQNSTNSQWPYGPKPDNTWPYAAVGRSPVLAVVGDVACQPGETEPMGEKAGENCVGDTVQNLYASQAATAKQIETMKPDLIALVGDEQYQVA
jgi:acid phosphatase type 7